MNRLVLDSNTGVKENLYNFVRHIEKVNEANIIDFPNTLGHKKSHVIRRILQCKRKTNMNTYECIVMMTIRN